ncbi:MAG: hypothetical protein INH41_29015 [Myxococcaceae bacterium]|nr:hypothetical protein [Myxococcaceae bacterium]MCA3016443.1 hypothetical protein [Myxococcaceae bacterium]
MTVAAVDACARCARCQTGAIKAGDATKPAQAHPAAKGARPPRFSPAACMLYERRRNAGTCASRPKQR